MVSGGLPLVVCVSADQDLRERVVRQLDGRGAVVLCASLDELRAMLWPAMAVPAPPPSMPPSVPTEPWPAHPGPVEPAAAPVPGAGAVNLGDLVVDAFAHLVTWRGAPLPLTRLERELLARLATPPFGVWTYQRLFDAVWGGSYLGDSSILHSAVKRLRRKLRAVADGPAIETVRGVGYRLAAIA